MNSTAGLAGIRGHGSSVAVPRSGNVSGEANSIRL